MEVVDNMRQAGCKKLRMLPGRRVGLVDPDVGLSLGPYHSQECSARVCLHTWLLAHSCHPTRCSTSASARCTEWVAGANELGTGGAWRAVTVGSRGTAEHVRTQHLPNRPACGVMQAELASYC